MYVLNELLTAHTVRVQQNIFKQTLIEIGTLHLYDSFSSFCLQIIGQLFEVQ